MFNVVRTYPEPPSIAKNEYNKDDVLKKLRPMFFDKCYLCER
ncbi:HNH endonuclease, partial [Vibrio parahaemolyticus]